MLHKPDDLFFSSRDTYVLVECARLASPLLPRARINEVICLMSVVSAEFFWTCRKRVWTLKRIRQTRHLYHPPFLASFEFAL